MSVSSFSVTILAPPFLFPFSVSRFPLNTVYYFLLRFVLCLRIFLLPALDDCPFMKYASNYFLPARRLFVCLFCITRRPPSLAESVFARAFLLISSRLV